MVVFDTMIAENKYSAKRHFDLPASHEQAAGIVAAVVVVVGEVVMVDVRVVVVVGVVVGVLVGDVDVV